MLFSEIGDVLEDLSRNKQRLTLSHRAYSTLLHDDDIFEPDKKSKRPGGDPSSTLINQIFQNFHETAESSIQMKLSVEREALALRFVGQEKAEICTDVVLDLLREQLEKNVHRRQQDKGCSFFVRLSKPVLEALASDELREDAEFYSGKVGGYLKALLEEYCELPYAERERIYYKEQLQLIELAIANREQLKLTLNSRKKTAAALGAAAPNNITYLKPLCIQKDAEHLYNYLVGMTSAQPGGPWNIGCVRLSSIKKISSLKCSGFISAADQQKILEAIQKNGVQYLPSQGAEQTILVQLTPYGERKYHQILHLRPQYVQKEGAVYTFDCTPRQAENYFFKFGHDVKILAPQELAEKFKRMYESAAEQYE